MISRALGHCPGIGPIRLKKLNDAQIHTWEDAIRLADRVPSAWRSGVVDECHRCLQALSVEDIRYFVDRFNPADKWRILSHYLDQASFFDIETDGLECNARITVIVCWHRGNLHTFVEHENLDDFLNLLDEVSLLTSFNGSSFDVPRVLDAFHIPALPCPHIDLRWLCYHQGFRGGLKEITSRLGLRRPHDLQDLNGEMAIRFWMQWHHFQDQYAREKLLRYCSADVLLSVILARKLSGHDPQDQELWAQLPTTHEAFVPTPCQVCDDSPAPFGQGSPSRLRARRRMVS